MLAHSSTELWTNFLCWRHIQIYLDPCGCFCEQNDSVARRTSNPPDGISHHLGGGFKVVVLSSPCTDALSASVRQCVRLNNPSCCCCRPHYGWPHPAHFGPTDRPTIRTKEQDEQHLLSGAIAARTDMDDGGAVISNPSFLHWLFFYFI